MNLTANYEFFKNTVSSLMDPFTSVEDKNNIYKQFAGYKNLSSAEKKDFLNFLKMPEIHNCLWQIVMRMQERAANLASYKYSMESKQMNAEHQHVLQDSYIDYENSISSLQALFHPEKTNTGIGCYEDEAAWQKQFLEDDKQVLSSFDHYNEIVSYYRAVPPTDPLKTKPCMTNSATNLYYKMYKEGKNQRAATNPVVQNAPII